MTTERTQPVMIALAAAAGGTEAIGAVLRHLPADIMAAVLVVQRSDPKRGTHVSRSLKTASVALPIKQAQEGDPIVAGHVFICPADSNLLIRPSRTLSVVEAPQSDFVWLAADLLFESVAATCGDRTVAVVLTGGDQAGSWGLQQIKRAHGRVIAQDESTAVNQEMPRSAVRSGCVDRILPLDAIGSALAEIVAEMGE